MPQARPHDRVGGVIERPNTERQGVVARARSAWVSPSYFRRSFKAAFGETPHQYLTSRRLERAKALLRAGDLSVTEVCHAVGFSSLGSFSSQFRRVVGESPSAYRRRVDHADLARVPACYVRMWTRPRIRSGQFGEASPRPASVPSGAFTEGREQSWR